MKKIIFFLMTTKKYHDRQDNILSSWGKDKDLYFYSEHSDEKRKTLKVCDENNVEVKQIYVFNTIKEKFQNTSEWYFFGDDDTFVNVNLLLSEIDGFDKTKIHGQDLGHGDSRCWGELHYPSGGAGFLIHNSIIHNFFDSKIFDVNIGDVSFGLNMKDKNIEIEHNDRFLSQHPSFYSISEINKYFTFHYIKSSADFKFMTELCDNKNLTF